ncbi:GTP-binding protein [Vibrio alfacsensis]|uniref:GTP-binding protein n=1 Tax=Vibrio alfacsensis TaxID=1074311 RepID=A0ABM6YT67_9VIBR|nr:GTPase [Vibrio alfacsensis]AXY00935.1 GTP-binding protein [Vibrio alfacsensis]
MQDSQKMLEALKLQIQTMYFEHEQDKQTMLSNILKIQQQHVNILIVGPTGVGKSSTINALFKCDKAVVGRGVDPETMHIAKYELENITFYDSPGLGDGIEQDNRHAQGIVELLCKLDVNGEPLIDLVLVLLDGGSRDYGTTYQLLKNVIVPTLDQERYGRILVAINQADMAMKGRGWDYVLNSPMPELKEFLDAKVASTAKRIKESTGVDMTPIYYSAGYQDKSGKQQPYNMAKLLLFIVQHMPKHKRFSLSGEVRPDPDIYAADENSKGHLEQTKASFLDSLVSAVRNGVSVVADVVTEVVSNVVSKAVSFFRSLLPW